LCFQFLNSMAVLYGTQSDGSLIPVQADSQGRLVAELAGMDQSVVGDLLVTGDVQMSSLNGGALGGFRNWVMNGAFTVNLRGGDKRPPLGQYGFDRWRGVPGGLEQTIEALPAGRYTLSWTGGGMGSIGGVTAPSAFVVDLPGGDTSLIVPDTANFVQLEAGEVHTPFEHRIIAIEEQLCLRYFQKIDSSLDVFQRPGSVGDIQRRAWSVRGVLMRTDPVESFDSSFGFAAPPELIGSRHHWRVRGDALDADTATSITGVTADADF
jgi:hypothetical protein